LLNELPTADSRHYIDIINDIKAILKNPTVQASARIDPDIRQLLEDAEETISTAQRPTSARSNVCLARSRDRALDTYDSISSMKSFLEDESDSDDEPQQTNLRYRRRISNQPLPTTFSSPKNKYSVFHASGLSLSQPVSIARIPDSSGGRDSFGDRDCELEKAMFPRQLAALKKMGFSDDEVILDALVQTNGNVQMAAKLLERKEICK
jgi:hypothetical protein